MNTKIQTIQPENQWKFTGGSFASFAGNFGHTEANGCVYTLFKLDKFDEEFCSNIKLRENEKLFRFETPRAVFHKMKPLIKVNIVKGLAYFLVEGTELAEFEMRGVKLDFLNLTIN